MNQGNREEKILDGLKKNRPQLLRIICSVNDFQMALSSLTFLLQDWDDAKRYTKMELQRLRCYEAACIIAFWRPFSSSAGSPALSRKTIGVKLNGIEEEVFRKVQESRNKIVAHSDEDEMHFRIDPFQPWPDVDINVPQFTFDNGLLFERNEYHVIEGLLHRMAHGAIHVIWKYAQRFPEDIALYKKPKSIL